MMNCLSHGDWDNRRVSGCPACVVLLRALAEAAHEELEFTYSHPNAAMRGQVWTERKRCPKFYKAMQEYWKARRAEARKPAKKGDRG